MNCIGFGAQRALSYLYAAEGDSQCVFCYRLLEYSRGKPACGIVVLL
jgi:hypothetical protein